jgi:hypothetical protein
MYSQSIIAHNIARVVDHERARRNDSSFDLHYFPPDLIDEMVERLNGIVDRDSIKETGEFLWTRDRTPVEQRFIDNQMMLCQLDWRYWAENHCYIELASASDKPEGWDLLDDRDPSLIHKSGPLGKFILNGMQLALLNKLAELEDIAHDQQQRGVPVNGILLILLKARQLGASTAWQSLIRHRVNFYSYFQALVASIDAQSTQSLQRRSDRMWEKMPIWMRARVKRSTVDTGTVFRSDSLIELQDFKQQKDLGKGETWHGFHGTEISVVAQDRAEDHFDEGLFPAIPNDIRVLWGMESTAKGKTGWWYDFHCQVSSNTAEGGAGRFTEFFAPFYLIDVTESAKGQRSKYRMEVPEGWEPNPNTLRMAERVWETSAEYMPDRSRVRLPMEVLCWYERTRWAYYRKGRLNIFQQSYPVEPIDAFQHSAAGAFTTETIERLQLSAADYDPQPYRLMTDDELPAIDLYRDRDKQPIHHIAGYHLGPMHPEELDRDPRGIIWLWEQPATNQSYVQSADPTGGIPKWSRAFRTHNDVNIDNGCNQVWRKEKSARTCEDCRGLGWKPTAQMNVQLECSTCDGRGRVGGRVVQVAEFAAPIDPEEHALIFYLMGRLFRGDDELDECLGIVEDNNTGPLMIRKLQNTYNYTNLYQSESISQGTTVKLLNRIGFHSDSASVPVLHARGRIVLVRRDVEPRSKWMIKELSDAIIKIYAENGRERFYVPAGGGRHDDRMTTGFLAWWAALAWTDSSDGETAFESAVRELPIARDMARTDATAGEQSAAWNDAVAALFGGYDLHFGHHPDCDVGCTADHAAADAYVDEGEESAYSHYTDDDQDDEPGLF